MGSDRMKRYPIMKELNALNDIKEALNQLQGQSLQRGRVGLVM